MSASPPRPFTPAEERFGSIVIRVMTTLNVLLYRVTGGWLGGRFLRGAPVMLLTTTGRRSGEPRTVALLYLRDGDDLIVVGSKGGMSHHPLWFRNLETNPRCEVQLGRERRAMVARQASSGEKAALWPRLVAMYPDFASYQARTPRDIPVIVLSPQR
ncbi:MAG: nitroreductase family deazaflavin-dependent oxidoreductase [Candidatus Binatia bacterium]